MQSLVYMMQYGEDKKLRRMKRILLSLVSFFSYLGGMIAFTMLSVDSAGLYDACVCRLFGAQIGFFLPVCFSFVSDSLRPVFEYAVCTEGYGQYAGKCTCCFGIHYLGWLL